MTKTLIKIFSITFLLLPVLSAGQSSAKKDTDSTSKAVFYVCTGEDNCTCGTVSLQNGECPCGMKLQKRISQSAAKDLSPIMQAIANDHHLLGHMTDILAESKESREKLVQFIMEDPQMVELLKQNLAAEKVQPAQGKTMSSQKMDTKPVEQKPTVAKTLYTCLMHPDYISDKPGKCPECGMNLVPKKSED